MKNLMKPKWQRHGRNGKDIFRKTPGRNPEAVQLRNQRKAAKQQYNAIGNLQELHDSWQIAKRMVDALFGLKPATPGKR